MRYISIDIETTGLNKDEHQILEIAAIAQDLGGKEVSRFGTIVRWENLSGSLVALRMNSRLIHRMSEDENLPEIGKALELFFDWCGGFGFPDDSWKLNAAGKNFASFDGPFLTEALETYTDLLEDHPRWYQRRVLDPAVLFLVPGDAEPPNLEECLRRAGIAPALYNQHQAMDDAAAVRDLIEWHYTR